MRGRKRSTPPRPQNYHYSSSEEPRSAQPLQHSGSKPPRRSKRDTPRTNLLAHVRMGQARARAELLVNAEDQEEGRLLRAAGRVERVSQYKAKGDRMGEAEARIGDRSDRGWRFSYDSGQQCSVALGGGEATTPADRSPGGTGGRVAHGWERGSRKGWETGSSGEGSRWGWWF